MALCIYLLIFSKENCSKKTKATSVLQKVPVHKTELKEQIVFVSYPVSITTN